MIWSHLLKKSLMENFFFCAVFSNIFVLLHIGLQWLGSISFRNSSYEEAVVSRLSFRFLWRCFYTEISYKFSGSVTYFIEKFANSVTTFSTSSRNFCSKKKKKRRNWSAENVHRNSKLYSSFEFSYVLLSYLWR